MEWLALIVAVLCVTAVIATCPVQGVGRFLAPETLAVLVLSFIFGARPVFKATMPDAIEASGRDPWYLYEQPITPLGWDIALWVGICALVTFTLGVVVLSFARRPGRPLARDTGPWSAQERVDTWSFGATACLVTAVGGTVINFGAIAAIAGPQTVLTMFGGRSAESTVPGLPEAVVIAGMSGSLAAAVLLISKRNTALLPAQWAAVVFSVALSVFQVSLGGNRRFLIPALLIPIIAFLVRKPQRVTLPWVVAAGIGAVFLAVVPMVRSAGARLPGENLFSASWRYITEEGPLASVLPVFTSYDTEMIDYIAVIAPRLGGDQPWGWGRGTLLEFLEHPLPSGGLDGSTTTQVFSDEVLSGVWGGGCAEAVCPVSSVAGVSYFDGGFLGVAIGCFLFGAVLRLLSNLWSRADELSDSTVVVVVVLSAFALVAARTNTVHATWWAMYAVGFALVPFWVLRSRVQALSIPAAWNSKGGRHVMS